MTSTIRVSDDAARTDPDTDDALGYAPFAKRIADVVVRMPAPSGYVIAVQGAWGAGKSTALNFARAYIERQNATAPSEGDRVEVVEFRPWLISGHEDLVAAFFKVLKEKISPDDGEGRKLGTLLARMSKGAIGPAVGLAAGLAKAVDPTGGLGASAIGDVTSKGVTALLDAWLKEPSLQSTYEQLREELSKSGRRYLVVIDDIDRLEPEEIRVVMQLVKSVGSLPNVIYLLSYDRHIVSVALGDVNRTQGPTFVEKVVQHEIALPRPTIYRLLSLLNREITDVIGPTENSDRWRRIIHLGLERWIVRPRDVARLSNALNFSWAALQGEIDAQDLLAMEGLRLFDPQVFAFIRDSRSFLLGEGQAAYVSDEQRAAVGRAFRDSLPEHGRSERLELLGTLFPSRAKAIQGRDVWGGEAWHQQVSRRGVGTAAGYDAYFSMLPAEDAVPKAWIDEAVTILSDRKQLVESLDRALEARTLAGRRLVGPFLEQLHYRFLGPRAATPTETLLGALFDRGETILSLERDGDILGPRSQMTFLIHEMLRQWGAETAGERLLAAFVGSASPALCAALYLERGMELGVFPYPGDHRPEAVVDTDALERLGAPLLALIETRRADGTLELAPYYSEIAEAWAHLAGPEAPREWLTKGVLESPVFLARIASSLIAYSVGNSDPQYFVHRLPKDPWIDVDVIVEAATKFAGHADLQGSDALIVEAVARDLPEKLRVRREAEAEEARRQQEEAPAEDTP